MSNAKNSAASTSAKQGVEKLIEESGVTAEVTEEKTVPAQATGEKVTAERGEDGKLAITVSDADEVEDKTTKVQRVKNFLGAHKKQIIAGGVAVAAILLGVSVQKKRSTTEDETVEPAADEPTES